MGNDRLAYKLIKYSFKGEVYNLNESEEIQDIEITIGIEGDELGLNRCFLLSCFYSKSITIRQREERIKEFVAYCIKNPYICMEHNKLKK